MTSLMSPALASLGFLAVLALAAPAPGADDAPPIVPWPQSVVLQPGAMPLTGAARIIAANDKLTPLANVLAEEIAAVTGLKVAPAAGAAKPGDIELALDPSLKGERYVLAVGDRAVVRGGNYGALALGTASLLQALRGEGDKASLPRMTVSDQPVSDFRGLMIDTGRRFHSIDNLKQIVRMCRLYKIRYLQLHLTDDQLFMFPSKAYPLLGTKNDGGVKPYTLEELKGLVAYADARNVTIIPEYEVPGHSGAVNRAMPDLFKIRGTKPYEHHASINFAKPEVMKAVSTIVGEMCEVFTSTPYFHIGGDEADLALADQNPLFQAAEKNLGLAGHREFYRWFVATMNDVVKKNHKTMIVWEGFGRHGKPKIPKDVIVMAYEIRFYQPNDLVTDGYRVVNASWTPLYVVNKTVCPPEDIYDWSMFQFKPFGAKRADKGVIVQPSPLVIGGQMCAWEQPAEAEVPSLRGRVPAMSERLWNPAAGKTFADFQTRFQNADAIYTKLLGDSSTPPPANP
ncbi:MAG: family 20 glycosylhydrolase [Planctomycetota bacterium]|nr:family 20 glycosylhydrolase [Planctomycetota bacterium]